MPRPCTVCNSELRPTIEAKIIAGETTADIAAWATDNGVKISHMVVQRHKAHIENYEPENAEQQGLDAADFINDMQIEPPKFNNGRELLAFAKDTGRAIYANQLLIVRTKQEAYMKGQGRYPSAEIQALRTISSCVGGITDGGEKVYKDDEKAVNQNKETKEAGES